MSRTRYSEPVSEICMHMRRLHQPKYETTLMLTKEQIDEAAANGLEFAVDYALLTQAAALVGLRRLQQARRVLKQLETRGEACSPNVAGNVTIVHARLRIAARDLKGAAVLMEQDLPPRAPPGLRGEFVGYRGLICAARGREADAKDAFVEAERHSRYVDAIAINTMGRAILTLAVEGDESIVIRAVRNVVAMGQLDVVITACRAFSGLIRTCSSDTKLARALSDALFASRDVSLGRSGWANHASRTPAKRRTFAKRERGLRTNRAGTYKPGDRQGPVY